MLSDKTLRLVPREDKVSKTFLQIALGTSIAREHIEASATGTSESMKNISQDTIRRIPVPLPPLDVQHQIVQQLNANMTQVAQLREAAERQRQAVEALPGTLLREVFGRWEREQ